MRIEPPDPSLYQVLTQSEQETQCSYIHHTVELGMFAPVDQANHQHWNDVWSDLNAQLPPGFIRTSNDLVRVNSQFVRPLRSDLELIWYERFRDTVLQTFFSDTDTIYEFGCGNGWNLVAAQKLYPHKRLVGLDWAPSGLALLPPSIAAIPFDFFKPDFNLQLDKSAGVWTVGALEQTGRNWEVFLEYLLHNTPSICVHIEPIVEWYNAQNPVDLTAIHYHLARHYWMGFPAKMRQLAKQGKVEVIVEQRSYFGSKDIEGYSLIVWRPS